MLLYALMGQILTPTHTQCAAFLTPLFKINQYFMFEQWFEEAKAKAKNCQFRERTKLESQIKKAKEAEATATLMQKTNASATKTKSKDRIQRGKKSQTKLQQLETKKQELMGKNIEDLIGEFCDLSSLADKFEQVLFVSLLNVMYLFRYLNLCLI